MWCLAALVWAALLVQSASASVRAATCTAVACEQYRGLRLLPQTPGTPEEPFYSKCNATTLAYLSDEEISRQPDGFPYTVPTGTAVLLPKSKADMLLTLQRITPDCSVEAVARSYDGSTWHSIQPFKFHFDCESNYNCYISVDRDAVNYAGYRVDAVAQETPSTLSTTAARLLIQATFGPTKKTYVTLTYSLARG